MYRVPNQSRSSLRTYIEREDGVATIDWVMLCCGATATAIMALNMGQQSLGDYSSGVRDEIQSPYFQTSWTQTLEIPPEEVWGDQTPITPVYEDPNSGGDLGGNFNGNNGNGNDADGCDSSNPGNGGSCGGDQTDDDGAAGPGTDVGDGNTPPDPDPGPGPSTGGGTPQPGPITVANHSFEETGHGNGGWSTGVPGWTIQTTGSGDVGDFNPSSSALSSGAITGTHVAYLYHSGGSASASMSQVFDTSYSSSLPVEFSVDIGDGTYNFSDDEPYVLNIYAGSTLIGSTSGSTGDIDSLQTVSVRSTVVDPTLDGQPIRFEIVHPPGNGGDLLIDNVVGNVLPAPSAGPQVVTSPIAGCPDPGYIAPPVATTGNSLANQNLTINVSGGGATNLGSCSGLPGLGYYNANPSITLDLSGMTSDPDFDDLEVRLDSSCDTTLLIRDAQGNWYFDDDAGPALNSRLRLSNLAALNGQVSIWVGTYGPNACDDVDVRIRVRD